MSVVQSPSDDQRQQRKESIDKLVKVNTLLTKMVADDVVEFRKDAVEFMNSYDTQAYVGELNLGDRADDVNYLLDGIRQQLLPFLHQCSADLTPKAANWNYCNSVASLYLKPSLYALSRDLYRRTLELK